MLCWALLDGLLMHAVSHNPAQLSVPCAAVDAASAAPLMPADWLRWLVCSYRDLLLRAIGTVLWLPYCTVCLCFHISAVVVSSGPGFGIVQVDPTLATHIATYVVWAVANHHRKMDLYY